VYTILEHETMHHETLLYMFQQCRTRPSGALKRTA